jgi:hypothetical protein
MLCFVSRRTLPSSFGSSVGGILVAVCGSGWGLLVDAATYVLAADLFGRIQASGPITLPKRVTLLSDMREGWSEFVSHTWLWAVVLQATVWQAVWAGSIQVIGPSIAVSHIGKAAWSFVLASYTAGTIAGGLVALRWKPQRGVATGAAMTAVSDKHSPDRWQTWWGRRTSSSAADCSSSWQRPSRFPAVAYGRWTPSEPGSSVANYRRQASH